MTNNTLATTINLIAGDILPAHNGRTVASVERRFDVLGACIIRFTDGSWFHAGTFDPWAVVGR